MNSPSSFDLVLKGGHVVDPANDIDSPMDVGVRDGKIVRMEIDIPTDESDHTIDVSERWVTPGLIDIHVHSYHLRKALTDPDTNSGKFTGSLMVDAHFLKEGVTKLDSLIKLFNSLI